MPDRTICLVCGTSVWGADTVHRDRIVGGNAWPCPALCNTLRIGLTRWYEAPPRGCKRLMEQGVARALESRNAK